MPTFKVTLTLYYRRSTENEAYMNIPDLDDDNFNNFISRNNIKRAFAEDIGSYAPFGVLSDCEYDNDTRNLSFNLTIVEDTMFIKYDEDNDVMINRIKQELNNTSLEDSLYEGMYATYSLADARMYGGDFEYVQQDHENFIEIGLIDYRNYNNNIVVELVEE
jgi:hypothetical protein